MIPLIILFVASSVTGFEEIPANFTGFKVIKATIENQEHANVIRELEDSMGVNLWNEPRMDLDHVMMSVSPLSISKVQSRLARAGMRPVTVIHDLQSMIDKEKLDNQPSEKEKRQQGFDFGRYHTLEEISQFLRDVSNNYKDIATLVTIGTSYENRPIEGLRIASGEAGVKPVIYLEVGIHCREWVTTASSLYIINELTSKSTTDSTIQTLLDKYEWYIIPSQNPDGYVFTWKINREWRKTRSRNSFCVGTDANRNFDVNFCGQGSSRNPCSETYCGASAFSEKESQAIRDITTELKTRLKLYIAVHSFSQLWMYPYGYTKADAPNRKELERLALVGTAALRKRYQTMYKQGPISQIIYVASGSSVDWVYDKLGTKLAYALELRDTGRYGFILPKEQIIPTAEETWDGITALIISMKD